jgi:beta-lactamase class A
VIASVAKPFAKLRGGPYPSRAKGRFALISRRLFAQRSALAIAGIGLGFRAAAAQATDGAAEEFRAALEKIEAQCGGRLGVAFLDSSTGAMMGHRVDERFPMCSTFKALAAGAVLAEVDAGRAQLGQRIRFGMEDLVAYSPITKGRVGEGMTVAELCAAAVDYSDNTAGNMLLRQIGGPAGLTRFARSLGDEVTRLDRVETELNESLPGDPRDTTSPAAMLGNLNRLVLGSALSDASRELLALWLRGNTTGATRLRAGLPAGWVVGDKTGTGDRGSANDIAVIWPPDRKPALVTAYLTGSTASIDVRSAALAAVGHLVAARLGT